jgi:hypothetical protein
MKHGPGKAYNQITKKWTKGTWINNMKVDNKAVAVKMIKNVTNGVAGMGGGLKNLGGI